MTNPQNWPSTEKWNRSVSVNGKKARHHGIFSSHQNPFRAIHSIAASADGAACAAAEKHMKVAKYKEATRLSPNYTEPLISSDIHIDSLLAGQCAAAHMKLILRIGYLVNVSMQD
jgi:hypothetical protein